MSEQAYWLGFSLIPNIGPKRLVRLFDVFGDLAEAWRATVHDLREAGLDAKLAEQVVDARQKLDLSVEMTKVERADAWLITFAEPHYPALLRDLDDPPVVLYVRGDLTPQDETSVAIVGTRKATRYGHDAAYDLAKNLSAQGVTIISGLAQGIDRAAHEGALRAGGRTIAVMGCGIDMVYPREHEQLAQQIIGQGALVSEFPVGMQPMANNFPRRNRVMSGMALGVLVAEAPERSGALITAHLALEQGREVFAVPGNIFNPTGKGANRLIQDGAKLVTGAEDVLSELNIAHEHRQVKVETAQIVPSDGLESQVLAHISADPIHIDDLVRVSGLPITDVSSTLTILELKGLAQMVGHMQYSRVQ